MPGARALELAPTQLRLRLQHVEQGAETDQLRQRIPWRGATGTQAQITHGQQIFESSEAGCIGCHNGEHFTNNQNADVGTGNPGETFQVPGLLGVAGRAPYMHDGCAATLNDRFDPTQATCNGGESHGHTAQLAASDVNDLISYLETL